ncbi:glycoside hydrolase family 18 protein [Polychaeton citri CBS 116435]|uniref:chitinase n=1 Tax=Polychaeton citri CBS 116435 TaxID=1314669 RepID=A0A9P4URE0_9PEZI|nr:glycoside hydrolase family 18 protein [Polychaeton citri CBS 116435]
MELRSALGWRFAAIVTISLSFLLFALFRTQTPSHSLVSRDDYGTFSDAYDLSSNASLIPRDDGDYSCSKENPCSNGACCGKGGYCGYGPTYCGDGCQSNCDAVAECGEYAVPAGKTCPLNVCCSQFGFCGTTTDFCDDKCQSNCGQPSVPAGGSPRPVRERVIMYYESWSARRKCQAFQPSNIPLSGITHVNFAFAYIDPNSFEVTTMDGETPESLFQQTTGLKSMKSGLGETLDVFISIGGWTFSDNDTATQPVFGNIASSSGNRQKFADNLVKFMTRYGFDGVDLDWEYPGAPDRGGQKGDTANYIELIRTLRTTFDRSPRGGYGLTFTIPSSYWYLRWFDVPNLIKAGADWVNLMSYDLHGVWDRNNPIGNIVQGHTNLTEIKQSVDLLWRNDVPPGKVVLGTGFYGRSFTLSDSSCGAPGCEFKGAANAGECTGAGGILGFFEIQDILKNGKGIQKIHDAEAAVNYFTYDDNQWVSYDDATTFEQKVNWADSVGLGGLMAWSIDMDDDQFTALSGLIGKPAGEGINKTLAEQELQTASWSSDNGQDCYSTDCGSTCPPDWAIMTSYKSNCGSKGYKKFCCPRDRMPRDCTWRGGESGGAGRACHGQCHVDGYGSRHCATGQQAFCCTADRYKDLVSGCQLGDCGGSCDKFPGTFEVAKQYDFGSCWNHATHGYKRPMCCKENLACHWVGKGSCDDNLCDGKNEIELALSGYGDSSTLCGVAGRKKSLCCNAPDDVDPFTPVPLEYIFPEVPPATDPSRWDLQILGGGVASAGGGVGPTNPTQDPNDGPFGFVLISGPKDVVSSFSKRDDSHIEVVECPAKNSTRRQTTRIFCSNDSESSNCDDVLEGGLEGTVVRMPDNCGAGSYIVAHALRRSENQTLPSHLAKRMPVSKEVMDLEFSYDFGLMKRADDKVYLRIDYSNMPGYWDTIVNSPGEKRKRSLHPRELSQRDLLDKRFFSSDSASWGRLLNQVDDGISFYSDFSFPATEVIVNEKLGNCGEDAYLEVNSDGNCKAQAKFGFTMVGTLQPYSIDEAYGFVDFMYDLDATVEVSGHIGVDTAYEVKGAHISPKTVASFSHPGIVSFRPSFDIDIGIRANNISFSGDFKTHFRSSTDSGINGGYVRQTFPFSAGGTRGAVKSYSVDKSFEGNMRTDDGELRLSMIPNFDMEITLDHSLSGLSERSADDIDEKDTTQIEKRDSVIGASAHSFAYIANFNAPIDILQNIGGIELQVESMLNSLTSVGDSSLGQWKGDETSGRAIGSQPGSVRLHKQAPNENGNAPAFHNKITPYTLFKASILSCPGKNKDGSPSCTADICADGVLDCTEDGDVASNKRGDGAPNRRRSAHLHRHRRHVLHKPIAAIEQGVPLSVGGEDDEDLKGAEVLQTPNNATSIQKLFGRDPYRNTGGTRTFTTNCWNADTSRTNDVTYTSLPYPAISDWTTDEERYDNCYDADNPVECTDGTVSGHIIPNLRYYVTEHIIELQTFNIFFRAVAKNQLADPSQAGPGRINCDFIKKLFTDMLPSNTPVNPGSQTNSQRPMVRIMQAHGWQENWEPFVFLERGINAIKARLWKYNDPVERTERQVMNNDPTTYADGLVTIRSIINVFSYLTFPQVKNNLDGICNSIRDELKLANDAWVSDGNGQTGIVDYWDAWIRSHLTRLTRDGRAFAALCISEMRNYWQRQPSSQLQAEVLQSLDSLESQLNLIRVDLSGLA